MSFEKARKHLEEYGLADNIITLDESSATVELAAKALGCEPAHIAKSLTFMVNEQPVMIVTAGNVKIDNAKYKAKFGVKAKMITPEQVSELIGHNVGGVCPFGVNNGVDIYLDNSLKRFDCVYPAAGDSHTAVKLSLEVLEKASGYKEWVDTSKPMQ
ncbi:MAG: YbaK/EbsC family protein [Oscillospiraceae bacterium]|nr:YbaK/EbsC family protein [Oscillospiraceae bacterium]